MATTTKVLNRSAATTTYTTNLYTVPSATTAIITNIGLCNTSGNARTVRIQIGTSGSERALLYDTTIAANTTAFIDLKQVLTAGQVIIGGASATDVMFHISGVEIA